MPTKTVCGVGPQNAKGKGLAGRKCAPQDAVGPNCLRNNNSNCLTSQKALLLDLFLDSHHSCCIWSLALFLSRLTKDGGFRAGGLEWLVNMSFHLSVTARRGTGM